MRLNGVPGSCDSNWGGGSGRQERYWRFSPDEAKNWRIRRKQPSKEGEISQGNAQWKASTEMYMHFSRGDIYSPSMSAESGPGLQRKSCTGDPHPACRGGLSNAQQTATGRLGSVAQCGLSAYQQMILTCKDNGSRPWTKTSNLQ